MIIKEFKPTASVLQKYIKSFYFIKSDINKKTEFIYYPHFVETINIFCNAAVTIHDNLFTVNKQPRNNTVIISASKSRFRTAVIHNEYDIIGIQCYPLAIHNFFTIDTLTTIEPGLFEMKIHKDLNEVSTMKHIENRIDALETFFINSYKSKPLDKLSSVIQLLHDSKGNCRMNELERHVQLNRRTILRQFKKYLFCSFEDYKNTVRFRLAIQNYSEDDRSTSNLIADIAYYDQAHFINHFKMLSGESPKKLLKQIAKNPDSTRYFWKLKK